MQIPVNGLRLTFEETQARPKQAMLPHVKPLAWPRRPGHQECQPLPLAGPSLTVVIAGRNLANGNQSGGPRCLKYQQSKQFQTKLRHISITKRLCAPLGGGSWSERPGLLPQLIRARIVRGQLAAR